MVKFPCIWRIFMSDLVSFADFTALDIRVGTIVRVEVPSGSAHVYRLTIDFGKEVGERTIFSGLKQTYEPDELLNKQVLCVVNLEPKKVMGEESQGMLLAVDPSAGSGQVATRPILLVPAEKAPEGSKAR